MNTVEIMFSVQISNAKVFLRSTSLMQITALTKGELWIVLSFNVSGDSRHSDSVQNTSNCQKIVRCCTSW